MGAGCPSPAGGLSCRHLRALLVERDPVVHETGALLTLSIMSSQEGSCSCPSVMNGGITLAHSESLSKHRGGHICIRNEGYILYRRFYAIIENEVPT